LTKAELNRIDSALGLWAKKNSERPRAVAKAAKLRKRVKSYISLFATDASE